MASPLISEIKAQIAAGFKGKLLAGTLRRETNTTVNSYGDAVTPTVTSYSFTEGIRESFTARYREMAGIPVGDVSILILLGTFSPVVIPKQDDKVFIATPINTWYQVRRVLEIDPAGASVKLQAYEIPAP